MGNKKGLPPRANSLKGAGREPFYLYAKNNYARILFLNTNTAAAKVTIV